MRKTSIIVPLAAAILTVTFVPAGEKLRAAPHEYEGSPGRNDNEAAIAWDERAYEIAYAEVESIARDYIEGWYSGDVARMDRALHDDLVKRMPVREGSPETTQLHPVSKARMLELTAEGGGKHPDAVFEIIIDDVSRDIATARVASPEYLDYLHLAKTSHGWKIVNVLFHTRD